MPWIKIIEFFIVCFELVNITVNSFLVHLDILDILVIVVTLVIVAMWKVHKVQTDFPVTQE